MVTQRKNPARTVRPRTPRPTEAELVKKETDTLVAIAELLVSLDKEARERVVQYFGQKYRVW